jgi:hypothetical protein
METLLLSLGYMDEINCGSEQFIRTVRRRMLHPLRMKQGD